MRQRDLIAAFALWSVAFVAVAAGYVFAHLGRSGLALLALLTFVGSLLGMFSVGRRTPRSS